MKKIFLTLAFIFAYQVVFAQLSNDNTMSVLVDGKEFKAQPRQIKIGHYGYFTGNLTKPDRMLRISFWSIADNKSDQSGKYLILSEKGKDSKENIKKQVEAGNYVGAATIRYVEETKEPRMEYHMGVSQGNGEAMEVKLNADGSIECSFNAVLEGSYWKEKATATVLGGIGRLKDKVESKIITQTTGHDSDIDPEGRGYKRQDKVDTIVIKDGKMKFKKN